MLPSRYNISNLKKALWNPHLFRDELNRIQDAITLGTSSALLRSQKQFDKDLMEEDWDNLIILDACRYDAFSETNFLEGELEAKTIPASHSREFMREYFVGKDLSDTIYVTGNTHASKFTEDFDFHYMEYVKLDDVCSRDTDYIGPPEGHDSTVLPGDVVEKSLKVHDRFPNKRLIVHFMQPHLPFIGEYGNEIYSRALQEAENAGIDITRDWSHSTIDIWKAVQDERISVDEVDVWRAYNENVQIVLEYVEVLLDELIGRSVITADHGELLGESVLRNKRYGHPHDIRHEKLNTVPWLVINGTPRRDITTGQGVEYDKIAEDTIEDQLRALGYKS